MACRDSSLAAEVNNASLLDLLVIGVTEHQKHWKLVSGRGTKSNVPHQCCCLTLKWREWQFLQASALGLWHHPSCPARLKRRRTGSPSKVKLFIL